MPLARMPQLRTCRGKRCCIRRGGGGARRFWLCRRLWPPGCPFPVRNHSRPGAWCRRSVLVLLVSHGGDDQVLGCQGPAQR